MPKLQEEVHLEGIPVSEGIGIGNLYLLNCDDELSFPAFCITEAELSQEISRYRSALSKSRSELENLQFSLAKEGSKEAVGILDTHIRMLDDPIITTVMEEKIVEMMQNTESVFQVLLEEYRQFFDQGKEKELMHQKWVDVKDLAKRILKHLSPTCRSREITYPEKSVATAFEMIPTFVAEASLDCFEAFITEIGGDTSHAVLIARAKQIPFVTNISMERVSEFEREKIIVDANRGTVIINPNPDTLASYLEKKQTPKSQAYFGTSGLEKLNTSDGKSIKVWANLESLNDLPLIKEHRIDGIGLIRTEFLFAQKALESLSEEDQFVVYREICEKMGQDATISFRVFDVGGDKRVSRRSSYEPNPALGCRSIRYLMHNPDIFQTQVNALFRASEFGKLRIILPLVTDIDELIEVKRFIAAIQERLAIDTSQVQIGCMVEVPSFALLAEHFAKECDFFSIGTNDLVQFGLAIDRCNPEMQGKAHPAHPSILKLIDMTLRAARETNIPVSICGEIASNPLFVPLLIGLGVETFSLAPRYVPLVRNAIERIDFCHAREFAQRALRLGSFHKIHSLLVSEFSREVAF